MCIALGGASKILLRHIPVSTIKVISESTRIKKRTSQEELILFITTFLVLITGGIDKPTRLLKYSGMDRKYHRH